MGRRTFRPQQTESSTLGSSDALLTTLPVAVYYRQSTAAQVGNISTTIQTVDMVDELVRRGWQQDNILLIDDDEGVSGTTRIDERIGMAHLFELIADRKIGAVACQDEDRLFRDMTQIQVNIFIDTCRKSNVKVITPYLTYDFAHPLHGEFHARQFRFKCDMAAEYIKSYVLGRLAPARQRLLREGKWAGANMPIGYMVDMRKRLPSGEENPNWRKFVPFEPYAQVVREYFRVFLENGGAIRKSIRQIKEERISFPENCTPPDGFKIVHKLKWRGDGYYLNRTCFVLLLTNPVYIGHWCTQGVVTCWNNHAPIIDTGTFMRAFNYLSKYTLTGDENSDYQPAYQYTRLELDEERNVDRPLCAGLIFSEIETKTYRAGVIFDKRNQCYLYVMSRLETEGQCPVWARRSEWIDGAIVARFKQRLEATFQIDTWTQAIKDSEQLVEKDRKLKRLQLNSLNGDMQNLVASIGTLSDPLFIQEVENRHKQMQRERERLTRELANLDQEHHKQITMEQAYALFRDTVAAWDVMTQDEHRNVLSLFIKSIEATDYSRSGDMRLIIQWRDGNSDEIKIWHKSKAPHWTVENVEKLLSLFDSGASQLEVAAAFPELKWYQIYNEIRKHREVVRFTPSWLGKDETYEDYVASSGRKGRASGSYWREEELATLRAMVERQATQLEIMQEFPYRRWIYLKERIKVMFGKEIRVPLSGIRQRLTYIEYVQQQKAVNSDVGS